MNRESSFIYINNDDDKNKVPLCSNKSYKSKKEKLLTSNSTLKKNKNENDESTIAKFYNSATENIICVKKPFLGNIQINHNNQIFKKGQELGSGSFGYVYEYKAENNEIRKKFAMKIFNKKDEYESEKYKSSKLYDILYKNKIGVVASSYYNDDYKIIIMDRKEGNLQELFEGNLFTRMDIYQIIEKIKDYLIILLNNQIVYGDLKLNNILYSENENDYDITFGDIGSIYFLNDTTQHNKYVRYSGSDNKILSNLLIHFIIICNKIYNKGSKSFWEIKHHRRRRRRKIKEYGIENTQQLISMLKSVSYHFTENHNPDEYDENKLIEQLKLLKPSTSGGSRSVSRKKKTRRYKRRKQTRNTKRKKQHKHKHKRKTLKKKRR